MASRYYLCENGKSGLVLPLILSRVAEYGRSGLLRLRAASESHSGIAILRIETVFRRPARGIIRRAPISPDNEIKILMLRIFARCPFPHVPGKVVQPVIGTAGREAA